MTSKELNLMLISKFPELEGKYRENPNWQGGDETSPRIGYDELFRREIVSLLNTERYAEAKRYLDFLEELIVENDYDVDVAHNHSPKRHLLLHCGRRQYHPAARP